MAVEAQPNFEENMSGKLAMAAGYEWSEELVNKGVEYVEEE